jgi:hypothetical protein
VKKRDFQLLQLRVLRLGFLQDGNVGVGVFPEGEEIFVGSERPEFAAEAASGAAASEAMEG